MIYDFVYSLICGVSNGYGLKTEDCTKLSGQVRVEEGDILEQIKKSIRKDILSECYLTSPKDSQVTATVLNISSDNKCILFNKDQATVRVSQLELLIHNFG